MIRYFYTFLASIVFSVALLAQPVYNDCFNAVFFEDSCSPAGFFNNIEATQSIISPLPPFQTPTCWNGAQRDVWFYFYTYDSILDFEVFIYGAPDSGTIMNPQLAIYRGFCDTINPLLLLEYGCKAAPPGVGEVSVIIEDLDPFTQYFIRVNDYSLGAGTNEGTFQLCVIPYEAPGGADCDDPIEVNALPFNESDLTTCGLDNNYTSSPCNNDNYLSGEEIIFTYTPPNNECISINLTGTSTFTGLHIFTNCPDEPGACVGSAVATGGNPSLTQLSLNGGTTYYIAVSTFASGPGPDCTDFNISITSVPCPPPTAADLINAFPVCQNYIDAFDGSPCFQTGGIGNTQDLNPQNQGCILNGEDDAFWFYVEIAEAGQFMFTLTMNPASDIDFNVWGPFTSIEQGISLVPTTQPIRSSWAPSAVPTGLIDFHPVSGIPITDTWDCQGVNDSWVMPIDALPGEIYIILADDWINQSTGCMNIDFSNSTATFSDVPCLNFNPLQDTLVCVGELISIGDPDFPTPPYGDTTITWSPSVGLSCINCPNPQVIASQSTFYVWTLSNTLFSISDTVFINVISDVIATTNIDTTDICQGESVQLQAMGGTSFDWTPAIGLSCTDCPNPVASPVDTITYKVVVSAPCGIDSTYVTINTQAALVDFGDDILYMCKGDEIQLDIVTEGSGGTGLQISPQIGLSCYNCNDPVFNHNSTVTYVASFNTAGCTVYDTLKIRVDSLPAMNMIGDTTICAGGILILSYTQLSPQGAYPDIQFQWSPPPSPPGVIFISSTPTNNNVIAIINQTTTFVKEMFQNACYHTDTVTVTVEQPAVLTITPPDAGICPGNEVQLLVTSNNPNADFTWSPADGLSCTDCPNPVASPLVSTTYTVESGTGNCSGQASITIEVAQPEFELVEDLAVCAGESIQIGTINDPNTTYSWTASSGESVASTGNPTVTPNVTTTYILTASQGDCALMDSVTITVNPFPDITITSNETAFCIGETISLSAGTQVASTFLWSGEGLQNNNVASVTAIPGAPGTYTYTVTADSEGCISQESITITVDEEPEFELADDTSICPGQSVQIGLVNASGVTYSWSASTGETVPAVGNPTVNPSETTTYTLTAINGACEETANMIVTVQPLSLEISPDATICAGQDVQLNASGQFGNTYSWSPAEGLSCTDCANPVATPDQTTTYTVTYSLNGDCAVSEDVTITVGSNLLVTIAPDTTINQGATVQMTSTVVSLDDAELGQLTYTWSPSDGLSCTDCPNPVATPNVTTTYILEVISEFGCQGTSNNVTILIDMPLYSIPNAFTPDGDDINDRFTIAVSDGAILQIRSFRIFNRWGKLVYDNPSMDGWNGRHDGNYAPQDVYIYVIELQKADGTIEVLRGDVTLLR